MNLYLNGKRGLEDLRAGDGVELSGVILTARDCAHKRIFELLDQGKELPFEIENSFIYYAGPCPNRPGTASGSCGPTTSARMDKFAARLLDSGLAGIIGKGEMSNDVKAAIVRNKSVYFAAVGGAGALYGSAIKSSECIAFPDLISEGVYRLEVENFPVLVAYDSFGGDIYKRG